MVAKTCSFDVLHRLPDMPDIRGGYVVRSGGRFRVTFRITPFTNRYWKMRLGRSRFPMRKRQRPCMGHKIQPVLSDGPHGRHLILDRGGSGN